MYVAIAADADLPQILSLGTMVMMIPLIRKAGVGMHIYDLSYQQVQLVLQVCID
jgi:hypothetical protein